MGTQTISVHNVRYHLARDTLPRPEMIRARWIGHTNDSTSAFHVQFTTLVIPVV